MESRLIWVLNAAENIDYIEQKLHRIEFPTKNLVDAFIYLSQKYS